MRVCLRRFFSGALSIRCLLPNSALALLVCLIALLLPPQPVLAGHGSSPEGTAQNGTAAAVPLPGSGGGASDVEALLALKPTGDALLDEYFRLIIKRWRSDIQKCDAVIQDVKDFYGVETWPESEAGLNSELDRLISQQPLPPELEARFMNMGGFGAVLPREDCQALARQFAEDPRVYELLFEMEGQRWLEEPDSGREYWQLDRGAYQALASAAAAGKLRPQGLLLLTRLLSFTGEDYVEDQLSYITAELEQKTGGLKGQPGYEAALAAVLAENPQLRRTREELQAEHDDALAILASSGMDADGLYRRVTEIAPDWAEGWYLLAEHEQRAGRSAEALAALRRGNSAVELFSPLSYPMEVIDPLARSGATAELGLLYFPLRMTFSGAAIYAYDPGWWGLRSLLDQPLAPQQKLEIAQELHLMLIRRARMSGPALHTAELCLIVEGKLQNKIQEQLAADLSSEALEELRGLHEVLRAFRKANRDFQEAAMNSTQGSDGIDESSNYSFSGTGVLASLQHLYRSVLSDAQSEQQFSDAKIRPLLDELEGFDYNRLGLLPARSEGAVEAQRPDETQESRP